MHRILKRQLRHIYGSEDAYPHDLEELFKTVSKTYTGFEESAAILERTLDVSSTELTEMNKKLREEKALVEQKVLDATKDLEKFKLAVDNTSDHVTIADNEGNILYANKSVERITEYSQAEVLGKKNWSTELWGGLMEESFYTDVWNTIKEGKVSFSGQVKNQRKGGEEYFAQITISPIMDSNGEVKFFVGIERDVTKEHEVDQAKTEFVALASHQLRTPLSAINWYVEMLLEGGTGDINEKQKKFLEEIRIGNSRMVTLVNSLLNVSRLELGTFMIEPEDVNIISIAKDALHELSNLTHEKHLNIVEQYDEVPIMSLDKKLTYIIFQNLLSNAVKYSPEKSVIHLNIAHNEKDVSITVTDEGIGIPKSQQDKLFLKLFRADNVKENDTVGTGLGLYMVKQILDASGGTITFTSEENQGTTFIVTLPLTGMQQKDGRNVLS